MVLLQVPVHQRHGSEVKTLAYPSSHVNFPLFHNLTFILRSHVFTCTPSPCTLIELCFWRWFAAYHVFTCTPSPCTLIELCFWRWFAAYHVFTCTPSPCTLIELCFWRWFAAYHVFTCTPSPCTLIVFLEVVCCLSCIHMYSKSVHLD
jgi:hypothetical protein